MSLTAILEPVPASRHGDKVPPRYAAVGTRPSIRSFMPAAEDRRMEPEMRFAFPRVVRPSLQAVLLLICGVLASSIALSAEKVGIIPNHAYDGGPTDSIDLLSLNPIVSQPLSPVLSLGDTLQLFAGASYGGFSWGKRRDPITGLQSVFYLGVSPGVVGAGWRFGPGRIWRHERHDSFWNCDVVRSVYVGPDGGDHLLDLIEHRTKDGSRLSDIVEFQNLQPGPPVPCSFTLGRSIPDHYVTQLQSGFDYTEMNFDPQTGSLSSQNDVRGNKLAWAYMDPNDFEDAGATSAGQYTFDTTDRWFPETSQYVTEVIKVPKSVEDSMGRSIGFHYGLIQGWPKFLLTEVHVPTPNGTGIYQLHYQMRTISSPPPGWPMFAPTISMTMPFLVEVELPAAGPGAPPLNYQYDYTASGELSEIRYPTGARTVLNWGDVTLIDGGVRRGIGSREVCPGVALTTACHLWRYEKAFYPTNAGIADRDRTIITDPAGNETEYRFFEGFPGVSGSPGAIRYYQGEAPRYLADSRWLSDHVKPYTGKLVRVVTYYYRGYPSQGPGVPDEEESIRRLELTTFYDDPLKPGVKNIKDPGVWFAEELNVEIRDPLQFNVREIDRPEGFAGFRVAGVFDFSNSAMISTPYPGWKDTTESGNLVGHPRRIQGRYNGNLPRWVYRPSPELITQDSEIPGQPGYVTRTDFGDEARGPFGYTVIRRSNPSTELPAIGAEWVAPEPEDFDVVTKYFEPYVVAGPSPVPGGSLSRIEYSGGGTAAPAVPADPTVPAYTDHMGYEYGALAASHSGTMLWLDTEVDVGPTGLANITRDSAGIVTTHQYDDLGRPTAIIPTLPELPTYIDYGPASARWYDTQGNLRTHRYSNRVTVSRGTAGQQGDVWTENIYDGLGHVTRTRRLTATGAWVLQTRSYDGLGSPTFVSEWHLPDDFQGAPPPPGTTISYAVEGTFRDPFSRPTRVTTADGSKTDIEYFGLNSRVTVSGINGVPSQTATTTYYRDYRNRTRIVDAPEGADAIYTYDSSGNLIRVRLVGQVQLAAYNADPAIPSLKTNRFMVTNPESEGQSRNFTFNALGNLVAATHPEKGTTTYLAHDGKGNLLLMQDAAGTQFRYTYDEASRLTLTETRISTENVFRKLTEMKYKNIDADDPGGLHGAGALGRPIQVKAFGPQGLIALSIRDQIYGGLNGRVSAEKSTFSSWMNGVDPAIETSYTHDNYGQISQIVYPVPAGAGSARLPTRLTYSYTHGFLTRLDSNRQTSDPTVMSPLITDVTYNLAGGVGSISLANGVVETTESDIQLRPRGISVTNGTVSLWDSGGYEYDGAANIIAMGGQTFVYDPIGRLTSANVVSPVNPAVSYQQGYGYDEFGNMTMRSGAAGEVGDQIFDVDGATNRLVSLNMSSVNLPYSYNGIGAVTNDSLHAYRWDRAGRLDQLRTVDNSVALAIYNYDDRDYRFRVSTDGSARQMFYLRDASGQVLTEFARPSSLAEPQWRKDYIHALGRHVAVVEITGPGTPAGVMSSTEEFQVTLSWMDVSSPNLFGYDVYRSTAAQPENFIRLTPTPLTTTTYTRQEDPGETYRYRIGAVDDSGLTSELTAPRRIKVGDVTPPPAVADLTGDEIIGCSIILTWEPVAEDTNDESDIVGYNVYRRGVGDPVWPATPGNGAVPIQTGSYHDFSLVGGASFEYGLETLDAAGSVSELTTIVVTLESCGGRDGGSGGSGGSGGGSHPPVHDIASGSESPYRVIAEQSEVTYRIRYFHVDHLGTPRVITDAMGAVVAKAAFFPFGEAVPGSTTAGNTHWFTGHERDFIAGQDYMLGRETSIATARFVSPDPTLGNNRIGQPHTWNLYAYGDDTPLVAIDPDGLASIRRRGLTFLPNCGATPTPVSQNSFHEQIFYSDGNQPGNSGFFSDGTVRPDNPANLPYYWIVNDGIDDAKLRRAEANVQEHGLRPYSLRSNNCQDYITLVMAEFSRINRGERLLKDCKAGKVASCKRLNEECAEGKLAAEVCAEYEREKARGNLPNHTQTPTHFRGLK